MVEAIVLAIILAAASAARSNVVGKNNVFWFGSKLHIVFPQIGATNKFHIYNVYEQHRQQQQQQQRLKAICIASR